MWNVSKRIWGVSREMYETIFGTQMTTTWLCILIINFLCSLEWHLVKLLVG